MPPQRPQWGRDSDSLPTGNTYDKYGTTNPIAKRLMTGFLTALDELLPATPPDRVVEVGVGEGEIAGRIMTRYPGAPVFGIDLADDGLAAEWRARGVIAAFGDIRHLPIASRSADLVLAVEVLEHVGDPIAALAELARVATANVILSVPREPVWRVANMARGKYLRSLGNTPGHVQHWSSRSFVKLVGDHFDVTEVRTPFPWTIVAARVRSSLDRS